jgi:nucleoid-associated protein Lsr2
MAQKLTVTLEDDLDGGPADETVRFAIDSADYEIDLSTENATTFRQQLAPFIEHARKVSHGPSRRPKRTPTSHGTREVTISTEYVAGTDINRSAGNSQVSEISGTLTRP